MNDVQVDNLVFIVTKSMQIVSTISKSEDTYCLSFVVFGEFL